MSELTENKVIRLNVRTLWAVCAGVFVCAASYYGIISKIDRALDRMTAVEQRLLDHETRIRLVEKNLP